MGRTNAIFANPRKQCTIGNGLRNSQLIASLAFKTKELTFPLEIRLRDGCREVKDVRRAEAGEISQRYNGSSAREV